jgi:hypothetical protein
MGQMNGYYLEQEMNRRAQEFERQASAYHLARVAQGQRPGPLARSLDALKCRVRDRLAGLGVGLEPCAVRPVASVGG